MIIYKQSKDIYIYKKRANLNLNNPPNQAAIMRIVMNIYKQIGIYIKVYKQRNRILDT